MEGLYGGPRLAESVQGERGGWKLVDKVVSKFFVATDYSPEIKPSTNGERVFEMRTYVADTGKLDAR